MNARVEYTRNENNIRDRWGKHTIFAMINGNETQLPPSPHKATTDPEHTAPDSHSPPARPP